jgi:hypothetical protein
MSFLLLLFAGLPDRIWYFDCGFAWIPDAAYGDGSGNGNRHGGITG